ncbi:MAG: phosphotransferase, partial [Rhodobacter sp.]|nr:phosphotransferase [Rhodobacter sp.]
MDERQELAREFASRSGWGTADMMALAGDASARRYFRLDNGAGGRAVLMDAPPAAGQSVKPFLDVAAYLHGLSLSAPVIEAYDEARGFVLMEDLG